MKLKPAKCTICGAEPWGEVNTVVCELTVNEDGTVEFSGETNLDTIESVTDVEGRHQFVCDGPTPHMFWAEVED